MKINKIIRILGYIFLITCVAAAIIFSTQNLIDGELVAYEKNDFPQVSNDFVTSGRYGLYDMSRDTALDAVNHPEKYLEYDISFNIKNITPKKIYDIDAKWQASKNVWMLQTPLAEWEIDIRKQNTYKGSVFVIIKTEGMTEDEIDKRIKSIGLLITAKSMRYLPFYSGKTIHFKNG